MAEVAERKETIVLKRKTRGSQREGFSFVCNLRVVKCGSDHVLGGKGKTALFSDVPNTRPPTIHTRI